MPAPASLDLDLFLLLSEACADASARKWGLRSSAVAVTLTSTGCAQAPATPLDIAAESAAPVPLTSASSAIGLMSSMRAAVRNKLYLDRVPKHCCRCLRFLDRCIWHLLLHSRSTAEPPRMPHPAAGLSPARGLLRGVCHSNASKNRESASERRSDWQHGFLRQKVLRRRVRT